MPLSQQVITHTINKKAKALIDKLEGLTPGQSYGTAVAFVSLVGGYQTYYCRGWANDFLLPATESTIFNISSLTKPFTSMLLALSTYNQNLKVSYTDPVTQYLTYYRVAGGSLLQQITLRDLAMHTSGLRDATLSANDAIGLFQDCPSWPPSDLTDFWESYVKGPTPGSCWEYSDLGFVTLGYAVVAANSANYTTYAGLLSEGITGPLNMPNTAPTVSGSAIVAQGHYNGVPVPVTGAADLKSNLTDLYQWTLQNLLAPTIQNPDTLMQALAATTAVKPLNPKPCTRDSVPANMGLAWQGTSGDDGYPVIVWKDGATSLSGCSGWIGMIPAQQESGTIAPGTGMGIVLLVNGFINDYGPDKISVGSDTYGFDILQTLYKAAVS